MLYVIKDNTKIAFSIIKANALYFMVTTGFILLCLVGHAYLYGPACEGTLGSCQAEPMPTVEFGPAEPDVGSTNHENISQLSAAEKKHADPHGRSRFKRPLLDDKSLISLMEQESLRLGLPGATREQASIPKASKKVTVDTGWHSKKPTEYVTRARPGAPNSWPYRLNGWVGISHTSAPRFLALVDSSIRAFCMTEDRFLRVQ